MIGDKTGFNLNYDLDNRKQTNEFLSAEDEPRIIRNSTLQSKRADRGKKYFI